ncbi:MAG TPA: hypothetical protein VFP61_02285 [Acidimicrobiales bacterium]|nr:hypothetical protein [Acidimicrobiales bacterium]
MDAAPDRAETGGLRAAVLAAGELPLPGAGATAERLAGLGALGAADLAVARLAEGHADAVAILAEAGRRPEPGCAYGVWASVAPEGDVTAAWRRGEVVLSGTKPFCSGAALCDRALVRCGDLLVDVDLRAGGAVPVPGTWPAVGMAASDSRSVRFEGLVTAADAVVGPPGWYLRRPGFWHGGVGVAAVWAGGARGVVAATTRWLGASTGEAELAALGTAVAALAGADALIDAAARAIDAAPTDPDIARRLALVTRHGVHAAAVEVLRSAAAAGGARPLCLDGEGAQRAADLWAYLAQHHPGRDAARLGRAWLEAS